MTLWKKSVRGGGNLPAGTLTLPVYKRMQDFVPAEGKEVFIVTDRVTLLGKNAKCKTPDNPHLYKYLWPLLSEHFTKLTIKAMGGCKTADILREVGYIVNTKARGKLCSFGSCPHNYAYSKRTGQQRGTHD